MGPVEFEKVIYECKNEEGKKCFVCLPDEYLNMKIIGFMSTNLVEKIEDNEQWWYHKRPNIIEL